MATQLQMTFTVEGLDASTFVVTEFQGSDTLSQPFTFAIDLASSNASISPENVVDHNATLSLYQDGEATQQWQGIVSRFSQGDTGHQHTFYQVEMVPPLMRLSLRHNSRIFQSQTVPDIISILIQEMNIQDFAFALAREYPKREYCVQYRETDLAFIQRIAAEEGILYYFSHDNNKNTVVFADDTKPLASLPQPVPYNGTGAGISAVPFIRQFKRHSTVRPASVQLKDRYFKKPAYSFLQTQQAPNLTYQHDNYEHYDYPGRYKDDESGKPFAQVRLESLRRDAQTAQGKSNVAALLTGEKFTLQEHNDDKCNRDWLVIELHHHGKQPQALEAAGSHGATTYHNEFTVIAGNLPWRAPMDVKPRVDGPQIATIVGPKDEEIYCDEYGRVKVQFPWDRYSNSDDKASCWVRVAQGWAGSQYGMLAVPRIGHEVIVSFLEGDPDQPIITGRTFNALNPTPYKLPDYKTRTVLRTETHQGDGYNELHFEDQKDKQQIYVHAQKDMNLQVNNDRTDEVDHDWHQTVANERFSHVKVNDHLTVDGESRQHTKGNHTLITDATLNMKQAQSLLVDTGQEVHVKSGGKLVLDAGSALTLKAGENFIKINASGVTIVGKSIDLNSGGKAGKGSDYAGVEPLLPGGLEPPKALDPIQQQVTPATMETLAVANIPLAKLCQRKTDGSCPLSDCPCAADSQGQTS